MKKIISVFLAITITLSLFAVSVNASQTTDEKLMFNQDGTFKIIQVADLQDNTNPVKQTNEYIREIAKDEKPDLFILTGDNISDSVARGFTKAHSEKKVRKAIDAFMSVFEEIGVPVAIVFGNHDAEGLVSKEEQMAIYQEYDCCIAIDEGESLYGCGTYNLPVYSSDGEKVVYNLWMFDSNMYDDVNGGYDHVHEDQIEWYVKTSNELKAQNDGQPVPSMVFQHIIVNEIFDALEEVEKQKGAVKDDNGKYFVLPEGAKGTLREIPCPGEVDSLQFEKMVEQGDVKAMFFGHDHKNDFEISHEGIDIVNTPTSGFGSYGDDNRGVRVITLNEEDTSVYETEIITYLDNYCTEPLEVFLYHVQGLKYIWDMFLMGLTYPIKAITTLFA
ncbi:MAG: metallophosphoesterase family protein [Clostridia bacterium]|nr:metallophosphoesterase family protein [Clostridia bacterium]